MSSKQPLTRKIAVKFLFSVIKAESTQRGISIE